jgi:hypothetical protein
VNGGVGDAKRVRIVNSPCRKTLTAAPILRPSGQSDKYFPYATDRRSKTVKDRAEADTASGPAGLALEVLGMFLATVAATADAGVDLVTSEAVVPAVGIRTGVPAVATRFLRPRTPLIREYGIRGVDNCDGAGWRW